MVAEGKRENDRYRYFIHRCQLAIFKGSETLKRSLYLWHGFSLPQFD